MTFYVLIFGFFFQSLYIGVVVNTFDDVRIHYGQYHLLSDNQRKWVTMKNTMKSSRALILKIKTKNKLSKLCFYIKQHWLFKLSSVFLLLFYTYLLLVRDPSKANEKDTTNYHTRLYLLICFSIEFAIHIKALKNHYFRDKWNMFEFTMFFFTLIGYIMGET